MISGVEHSEDIQGGPNRRRRGRTGPWRASSPFVIVPGSMTLVPGGKIQGMPAEVLSNARLIRGQEVGSSKIATICKISTFPSSG